MTRHDLTGQVFGTIKVLGFAGKSKHGQNTWNCICVQCKQEFIKSTGNIKQNGCISCSKKKHGNSHTSLYNHWRTIKRRCQDQNYKNYCGRGISIYDEWNNFEVFKEWALENGYKDGLEIDRIDFNGDYTPKNCRWVTEREQQNNRRNNINYIIDGEKHTITEWARVFRININTVKKRIKLGWGIKDALTMDIDKNKGKTSRIKYFIINGINKSFYDWCEVFQISGVTVRKRMKRGMSLVEALGVSNGK